MGNRSGLELKRYFKDHKDKIYLRQKTLQELKSVRLTRFPGFKQRC